MKHVRERAYKQLTKQENLLLLDTVVVKCKRGETTWFDIVVWNFKKINVGRRDPLFLVSKDNIQFMKLGLWVISQIRHT